MSQILVGVAAIMLYLAMRPKERRRLNLSIADIWVRANDLSPEMPKASLLRCRQSCCAPACLLEG